MHAHLHSTRQQRGIAPGSRWRRVLFLTAISSASAFAGDVAAPQSKLEDNVLATKHAATAANADDPAANLNVPYPPRLDEPRGRDVTSAGGAAAALSTAALATAVLVTPALGTAAPMPGAAATKAVDSNTFSVASGARPSLANTANLDGAINGVSPGGPLNAPSGATPTGPMRTFVYTQLPGDYQDAGRYGDHASGGVHGSIAVTAGTGGMMETSGSITLPLLNNELILRLSAAKGGGLPYGGYSYSSSRDSFYGGGFYNEGPYDQGLSRYRTMRGGDSTRFGFDLQWTPSDSLRIDAQGSQSSGQGHDRRK